MLKTLINPVAPGGSTPADHVIDLTFGTQINNIVYTPPSLPTLLNIINGGTYDSNFTKAEHTFILNLKADEVVELRIHGAAHGITHPFHIHGHAFDVVQSVNYKNPAGLAIVFAEVPRDFRDGPKSGIVTLQYLDLCPAYDVLPA
ncbi:hypothetical protein C8R44DRAFT_794661, partial [Mycena epipterygia]